MEWFCVIDPSGFRHITANVHIVQDAISMGWEVWHNQKRVW